MVSTKIVLTKKDLTPPIYLAGTFTSWQPSIEMDMDESRDSSFYKIVDIEPGEHQYKFRLGHDGDWWIHDENVEHVTDDNGFTNNILTVSEQSSAKPEPTRQPSKQNLRQRSSKPSLRWSTKSTDSSNSTSSSDITMKETHALLDCQASPTDGTANSYGTVEPSRQDKHPEHQITNGNLSQDESKPNGSAKPPKPKETAKTSIWHKLLCCFSAKSVIVPTALVGASLAWYMYQR